MSKGAHVVVRAHLFYRYRYLLGSMNAWILLRLESIMKSRFFLFSTSIDTSLTPRQQLTQHSISVFRPQASTPSPVGIPPKPLQFSSLYARMPAKSSSASSYSPSNLLPPHLLPSSCTARRRLRPAYLTIAYIGDSANAILYASHIPETEA